MSVADSPLNTLNLTIEAKGRIIKKSEAETQFVGKNLAIIRNKRNRTIPQVCEEVGGWRRR